MIMKSIFGFQSFWGLGKIIKGFWTRSQLRYPEKVLSFL